MSPFFLCNDAALVIVMNVQKAVRMKQTGWRVKFSHEEFIKRYLVCLPKVSRPSPDDLSTKATEIAENIAARLNLSQDTWAVGSTHVFFRKWQDIAGAAELVERGKLRLLIHLQSFIRGVRDRRIAQQV